MMQEAEFPQPEEIDMTQVPEYCLAALPSPCLGVVETHISWVLLTQEYAFKIKKPLTLPFLDYGTPEKRRTCCETELTLNRRFAPDLYLGVVDLAGEPAVHMRRFAEEQRLDHVSAHGDLTGQHLTQLARDLVAFQAQAAVSGKEFGTPDVIRFDALENFDELDRLLPDEATRLAGLRRWTEAEWQRHESVFAHRHAASFVREGHGDLHLGNLVMLGDRVVPFDGIEFNERLRHIDVASEIAFTLLDLLCHGRPGLAHWLLDAWLAWSGDFGALDVLRYSLVYRAVVRAKVAALRNTAGEANEAEEYLALAQRLSAPASPSLNITFGPSGCGKTYASSRVLATAGFLHTVRVRSDIERKRLFGLAPDAASDGTIYTLEATQRTYARLHDLAEHALQAGWSVIVDAAFLRRTERDVFRQLAARFEAPFAILAPTASRDEMAQRLGERQNDASEATVDILEKQLGWLEPLGPDEKALAR